MKDTSEMKRIPGIAAASVLLSSALITTALAHEAGRMTGGGSIVCSNGGFRVTHGFELHCIDDGEPAAALPNNLEINWLDPVSGVEQNFHLTLLGTAVCSDSPQIEEDPPNAGFDTMVATGTGTLNNVAGAFISFTFTDAGEPGAGVDRASFLITNSSSVVALNCASTVLNQGGNQQAHEVTDNT
jgi:hypothetical protein